MHHDHDRYGVPEVFEHEASGRVHLIYKDIKYVLKVPIVNFIFRTYQHQVTSDGICLGRKFG